ncbi:phosphatase PAP2 family protein (plasmid) [Sphingomonas paeninsulae]|uniref:Phosphatase PAP2 family protein n=1 Tax=Sphingomonas paeninsulae TaxID=2319844 RepID=A0A494TBW2_SPHPE|nr:phosphatase PAP2 family protein [Sphingomonas paeninsulae]AYJ84734.1 phosphatase PAP2 family protein [Sphingomonas paeninsulae]
MPNVKRVAKKQTAKVEQTDRKVAHETGGKRDTSFMKAVGKISDLADQPPLIALGATTTILGLAAGNDRLARTGMRILASHWLATAAKSFVKHRIDRTRPFVMLNGGSYHAEKGSSTAKRENSFPSGHTAGAIAVARAIAREYPERAPVAYGAAVSAAAVQLPRGTHFLSDVLVGGLIGFAAEAAISVFLHKNTSDLFPSASRAAAASID